MPSLSSLSSLSALSTLCILAALAACTLSAAGNASAEEPLKVPEPRLEQFDPGVRSQLHLLHAAAAGSGQAEAYGLLGETYLAYELSAAASAALAEAARLDPTEARWPYLGALAAIGGGDRQRAAELFDAALASRPGGVAELLPILLRSAANLVDLGRYEVAASRYREASDVAESSGAGPGALAEIAFGRGRLLAEQGRWSEAAASFRRALEAQPGADAVYYHLALTLRRAGDGEGARQAMALRGERNPTFRDPWRRRMQARSRSTEAEVLRGTRALKAGRLDVAEGILRGVLEDRDDVEALSGLAEIARRRGRADEAEALYRRALEADAESVGVLLNLGVLLAQRGSPEAADLLRRVVEVDPRSADGHYNLALQLLRQGDVASAEAALRRVLELRPGDAAALEALARSLAARGDFAAAVEPYRRLAELVPERPDVHFGLALALTLGGRCGEARPVLDAAVRRFDASGDGTATLHSLLARILAACPDDAARDGARAIELAEDLFRRSQNVETARTLGMALAEAGRTAEAAAHLRRTIDAAIRAGATQALPVLRRELAAYEAGRPVRSPWAGS